MADATNYRYKVDIIGVHDGDTVTVSVHLGFGLLFATSIRMAGINAPELSNTPTGPEARDYLRGLVAASVGQWTAVTYKTGNEKFGRWLCTLYDPAGTDICQQMIDTGHAVYYNP